MSFDDGKTIWIDKDGRYYLVPDDLDLMPGTHELRTLLGKRRDVDANALAGFEIPKEEAETRIKGKASGLVDLIKNAVLEAATGAVQSVKGEPPPADPAGAAARPHVDALKHEVTGLVDQLRKGLADIVTDLSQSLEKRADTTPPAPPVTPEPPVAPAATEAASEAATESITVKDTAPTEAMAPGPG